MPLRSPPPAKAGKGYTPTVAEVNSVARDLSGLGLSDSDDEERYNLLRHSQVPSPTGATSAGKKERGKGGSDQLHAGKKESEKPLRQMPLALQRGPYGRLVDTLSPALNPPVVLRMRCLVLGSAGVGKTTLIRKAIQMKEPNGKTLSSIPRMMSVADGSTNSSAGTGSYGAGGESALAAAVDKSGGDKEGYVKNGVPRIKPRKITHERQSYLPTVGVSYSLELNAGGSAGAAAPLSSAQPNAQRPGSRGVNQPVIDRSVIPPVSAQHSADNEHCYTVPVFVPEANVCVEIHCLDLGGNAASLASFDYYFKAHNFHLCNALLVVVDLSQPKSFGIQRWLEKVRLPQLALMPLGCVVGNKLDQMYDAGKKKFLEPPQEARQGAEAAGLGYFETSVFAEDDSLLRPFAFLAEGYARRYRNREEGLRDIRT